MMFQLTVCDNLISSMRVVINGMAKLRIMLEKPSNKVLCLYVYVSVCAFICLHLLSVYLHIFVCDNLISSMRVVINDMAKLRIMLEKPSNKVLCLYVYVSVCAFICLHLLSVYLHIFSIYDFLQRSRKKKQV